MTFIEGRPMANIVDLVQSHDSELQNIEMNDGFVNLSKASSKSSVVWNYFGFLTFTKLPSKVVNSERHRVFCIVCFEKVAENESQLFIKNKGNIKNFSSKTSTSNLMSHLDGDHKISLNTKSVAESTQSVSNYFSVSRRVIPTTTSVKKSILIRDMVLLCCRDLLPFNSVEGEGLRDFFEKYKVAENDEIPHRTFIPRALSTVYDDCKAWMVTYFKEYCPGTIAVTFDLWSCRYRRRSYITLTVHFITKNFDLINATLSTSHFPDKHKGVNILPRVESILDSFGLSDKETKMVTDDASNMRKTFELGTYKRLKCIGHSLHNLVIVDGFKRTAAVNDLLKKVRKIVKTLRYQACEFERLSKDEAEFVQEMSRLSEQFLFSDNEDDEDDEIVEILNEDEKTTYRTLKTDVATRWHSTVPMIESILINNKSIIQYLLEKYEHPELILTNNEYILLKELVDFLKHFQVITAILSGDKYATLNYYVIFRQEVRALLEKEPKDSNQLKLLKDNMLKEVDYRFPLSNDIILASLLDPRFQNLLDVQNYLKLMKLSAVKFIVMCAKDVIKEHQVASSSTIDKSHESAPEQLPKKSYIDDMVERHSTLASIARSSSSSSQTDLQSECFLLLSMGGVSEITNILNFWKDNSKILPLLSQVAAATYCITATSTPSERNFSTSGLVANSKASQITPENLDKVLFIHNNYQLIKKTVLQ